MPWDSAPGVLRYADSHVHLDRYSDGEAAAMVERARVAGVGLLLTVGCDPLSSRRAARLAGLHAAVEAAAGLHPLWVRRATLREEVNAIRSLLDSGQCPAAIGEIGLDGAADAPDFALQLEAFAAQMGLSEKFGLPVVVHASGTHREAASVLQAHPDVQAIIHYFTGAESDLRRYLDLGCTVSFGRAVLKPEHSAVRELAALVPVERLLVETDTYPLPGRVTEPRDVVDVVRALAETRGEHEHDLATQTTANLRRILRLDD